MREEALLLGARKRLVGVYSSAPGGNGDVAVILLNSGLIHHAGPAGLYTKLSRRLARSGIAALRFDLSGIGDSPPREDNLPIYQVVTAEPSEVMDDLQQRGFSRFILAGICAGAFAAFQTALADDRVVGVALINIQDAAGDGAWETAAWSRRYWSNSIFRPAAWLNLLTGRVNYNRLFKVLAAQISGGKKDDKAAAGNSTAQDIASLARRGVAVLFLLSGQDVSRDYLKVLLGSELPGLEATGLVQTRVVEGADHLFTLIEHQQKFMDEFCDWSLAQVKSSPS